MVLKYIFLEFLFVKLTSHFVFDILRITTISIKLSTMDFKINSLTGKKRRKTHYELPRKKLHSLASTVTGCMYSNDALQACNLYMTNARKLVKYLAVFVIFALEIGLFHDDTNFLYEVILLSTTYFLLQCIENGRVRLCPYGP